MKVSVFFSFLLVSSCSWLFGLVMAGAVVSKTITVDLQGRGQFTSVQKAVDSVPENNNQWIRIHVNKGIYKEKVSIQKTKEYILLEGEGATNTVIQWGDYASNNDSPSPMVWNKPTATVDMQTMGTATFSVFAHNFVARSIGFKNTYNLGAGAAKPITQAVAALIAGDQSAFYNCSFIGYQDTLCDYLGRHYFQNCWIEGAIDFIFGYAQSVYDRCSISVTGAGYVTAHGRNCSDCPTGFVFKHSAVVGKAQTFLGRAWAPYSRVLFYRTFMADIINPLGWGAWNSKGQENLTTYVEDSCFGPGSKTAGRVPWMKKLANAHELGHFVSTKRFINSDQWLQRLPVN